MGNEQPTVTGLYLRAQAVRRERPNAPLKEIRDLLVSENSGKPLPSPDFLTIPEQDARAPEEDWTAGLPLVLRGIQQKDWSAIADGIILSMEQTDGFEAARGGDARGDWHDRSKGIGAETAKTVGKWMPEELMDLAEKSTHHK
ncbi:MAG: hypothetical protein ABIP75_20200 [Pyrinomonadaceae bacterium]